MKPQAGLVLLLATFIHGGCTPRTTTVEVKPNAHLDPVPTAIADPVPTVSDADVRRIEHLILALRWNGSIGGHGPPFQIKGNNSGQELVRIGKPAVPFLVRALAPQAERNPLAKRRNVAAVSVLAEIGDTSAVDGIIQAMDKQWNDAAFQSAATTALAKLKDDRAIPVLTSVGKISLSLYARLLTNAPRPDIQLSEKERLRLNWWLANEHISSATMVALWMKTFLAIGAISPAKAMELARSLALPREEFQMLGAATLAQGAAEVDNKLAHEATSLCKQGLEIAKNPDVRQSLEILSKASHPGLPRPSN